MNNMFNGASTFNKKLNDWTKKIRIGKRLDPVYNNYTESKIDAFTRLGLAIILLPPYYPNIRNRRSKKILVLPISHYH